MIIVNTEGFSKSRLTNRSSIDYKRGELPNVLSLWLDPININININSVLGALRVSLLSMPIVNYR